MNDKKNSIYSRAEVLHHFKNQKVKVVMRSFQHQILQFS